MTYRAVVIDEESMQRMSDVTRAFPDLTGVDLLSLAKRALPQGVYARICSGGDVFGALHPHLATMQRVYAEERSV